MSSHDLSSAARLSDIDLIAALKMAATSERISTANVIALLAEVDARRLYLSEGCSSMFTYCTEVLHLSEHEAYGRIEAARAVRRFPPILDLLAIRREVWNRDGGQCAFRGPNGRCTERGFLEFHHVVPYADGGAASIDNLELRCGPHNRHEADTWFGAQEQGFVREMREPPGMR